MENFKLFVPVALNRRGIPCFQVGRVQFEHAETHVGRRRFGFADFQLTVSPFRFVQNFRSGAADALFADFADIPKARLVRLAFFVADFGKLYHNKLTVAAVLRVELHNRVGSRCATGKEVKDNVALIAGS